MKFITEIKFIKDTQHGIIDYAVAIALIAAPYMLGFKSTDPLAHWLSVCAGMGLFVYSLLTSYSVGARKLIPFKLHLALDFAAGVIFIIAPLLFGFEGIIRTYYLAAGISVVVVVICTDSATTHAD